MPNALGRYAPVGVIRARAWVCALATDGSERENGQIAEITTSLDSLAMADRVQGDRQARTRCEPKRLRYRLLHLAARLAFHARKATLRIHAAWPWAQTLADAFTRARALPAPA
jgi:hypothetical protein